MRKAPGQSSNTWEISSNGFSYISLRFGPGGTLKCKQGPYLSPLPPNKCLTFNGSYRR